jgi:hypothetical protein
MPRISIVDDYKVTWAKPDMQLHSCQLSNGGLFDTHGKTEDPEVIGGG